jgi:methylamine--corrinoid protein Co-methyltransferase
MQARWKRSSMPEIIEILERTQRGEYCSAREWDTIRLPRAIREKLSKFSLGSTFDPHNPVNCESTERIVRISDDELADALQHAPAKVFVGEGEDGTWIKARKPSDQNRMVFGASMGIMFDEEDWPLITEGIIRQAEVDLIEGPTLIKIFGRDVLAGTPFETLTGYMHARKNRELRAKAGRPGMGAIGITSSTTEFGQLGGYAVPGGFRPSDLSLVLFPSEMKINYAVLHKVVHTLNCGGLIFAGSPAMIGGVPGPPEGAVLSSIACSLLIYPILHAVAGGGEIYDVRKLTNVHRQGLWALSVANQALSRNTHLLTHAIANEVSGPCTETLLLESLIGVSTIAVSGTAIGAGPRPAGGKLANYLTPLECRFCAEVAKSSSGLDRELVNAIALEILPRYEDQIADPDIGIPFREAYDVEAMKPTQEWEGIYRKVKREAIALGVPLSAD